MFKQIFWKFLPRYGMKRIYNGYSRVESDVRKLFILNRFNSTTSHMMTHSDRLHIDPRGKCGARGKVLCYKRGVDDWVCLGKHKKANINGMNCKGS